MTEKKIPGSPKNSDCSLFESAVPKLRQATTRQRNSSNLPALLTDRSAISVVNSAMHALQHSRGRRPHSKPASSPCARGRNGHHITLLHADTPMRPVTAVVQLVATVALAACCRRCRGCICAAAGELRSSSCCAASPAPRLAAALPLAACHRRRSRRRHTRTRHRRRLLPLLACRHPAQYCLVRRERDRCAGCRLDDAGYAALPQACRALVPEDVRQALRQRLVRQPSLHARAVAQRPLQARDLRQRALTLGGWGVSAWKNVLAREKATPLCRGR